MSYLKDKTILVIDQGTSSSRAILFTTSGKIVVQYQEFIKTHYPKSGWVEQDPEALFQTSLACCRKVLAKISKTDYPSALAITNQRETTVIWERSTGKPIYPAIVWQDRRTQPFCDSLKKEQAIINNKTGLLIDPYFSASKINWILDSVPGARKQSFKGDLCFGTIDSWLIFKLTQGLHHKTDITNASRTMLFNIHSQAWDEKLLNLFNIPASLLPEVQPCHTNFGETSLLGSPIPILGVAGDQQASLIGQLGLESGDVKTTLGTGCFMMANTADKVIKSDHKLITTIAYRLFDETHYALEGSIFHAGSIIDWMRDNLGLFEQVSSLDNINYETRGELVYFIPAFNGLSAPHWTKTGKAAFIGIEKQHNKTHLIQACMDAICWQNNDLLAAMRHDGVNPSYLKVDGGISKNTRLLQRLADLTQINIEPATLSESTATGAMFLAAIELGAIKDRATLINNTQALKHIRPKMSPAKQSQYYQGWLKAINSVCC